MSAGVGGTRGVWCAVRKAQAVVAGADGGARSGLPAVKKMQRPSPEQMEAAIRIPVEGPVGDVRHVEDLMTDVMAKLVDLRGVAKPPMFTGRVEDWSEFRFKMENIAALLSLAGATGGEWFGVPGAR